jgi:hypothetical protein
MDDDIVLSALHKTLKEGAGCHLVGGYIEAGLFSLKLKGVEKGRAGQLLLKFARDLIGLVRLLGALRDDPLLGLLDALLGGVAQAGTAAQQSGAD